MPSKKFKALFWGEREKLTRQCREACRLHVANPQWAAPRIAEALGIHTRTCRCYLKSRVSKAYIAQLQDRRDASVVDYKALIAPGALQAVKRLIAIVTPGTKEYERAKVKEQIEAAKELLDREGSFVKHKHRDIRSHVAKGLTPEELAQVTGRNAGK